MNLKTWIAVSAAVIATSALGQSRHHHHILISDQFNNRVIEVDETGNIIWSFGNGSTTPGAKSVVAPNDAERFGDNTLISGTGTTTNADNRVLIVDRNGNIIWQYGKAGVTGSGADELNTPVAAVYLPNTDILITDQGNARIIEVTQKDHKIVWQYGKTGITGSGADELNNPNSAEVLTNGDILIADEGNNRVFEINPKTKDIVWTYGRPSDTTILNQPAFASRLDNGMTIISDSGNNRIVEINLLHEQVGYYYTNRRHGSVTNPNPTRALRLANGNTLISDQFNNQVIEIDSLGAVVWSYGKIGVVGNGQNELNAPYDAKEVDDFTGITPPFLGWDHW